MIVVILLALVFVLGILIMLVGGQPKAPPSFREAYSQVDAAYSGRDQRDSRAAARSGLGGAGAGAGAGSGRGGREYYELSTGEGFSRIFKRFTRETDYEARKSQKMTVRFMTAVQEFIAKSLTVGHKAKNLAIVERSVDEHVSIKILSGVGSAVGLAILGLMILFGGVVSFSPILIFLVVVAGGALGYWLPDSILHTEAQKRRDEFEQAMFSWLDITSQYLNTGEEANSAMIKASSLSAFWPFKLLNSSMLLAQLGTRPVQDGLRRLSRERGLDCLNGLVEALQLSSEHGAELADTLRSFIQAYRSQAIVDADAKVKTSAEQAALPLGLVVVAFLILLAYPGISGILDLGGGGLEFGAEEISNSG